MRRSLMLSYRRLRRMAPAFRLGVVSCWKDEDGLIFFIEFSQQLNISRNKSTKVRAPLFLSSFKEIQDMAWVKVQTKVETILAPRLGFRFFCDVKKDGTYVLWFVPEVAFVSQSLRTTVICPIRQVVPKLWSRNLQWCFNDPHGITSKMRKSPILKLCDYKWLKVNTIYWVYLFRFLFTYCR